MYRRGWDFRPWRLATEAARPLGGGARFRALARAWWRAIGRQGRAGQGKVRGAPLLDGVSCGQASRWWNAAMDFATPLVWSMAGDGRLAAGNAGDRAHVAWQMTKHHVEREHCR